MECVAGSGRAMDVDVGMCAFSPAVTRHELADGPGRFYLLRHRLLSSVTAKRRKFWLMTASALVPLSLGMSDPALAADECGPSPATCTPALNPYATGINYTGSETTPLSVTLQSAVNVTIPASSPGVNAVNLANTGGVTAGAATLMITADGVTINNANNPGGQNQTGLRIQSSGDAIIRATKTQSYVARGVGSTLWQNRLKSRQTPKRWPPRLSTDGTSSKESQRSCH
jgi:hypothetical protein